MPLLIRMAEKNFSVITECLLEHGALPDATAEVRGGALIIIILYEQNKIKKRLFELNS